MTLGRSTIFFKAALAVASFAGLAATSIVALVAVPVTRPPVLPSINEDGAALDQTDLPPLTRFKARDGSDLAFRRYPTTSPQPRAVAILVHGSSASNLTMAPLASALASRGVISYAVDIRGHGHSGTRGDIAYLGQLDDDMADLVRYIRNFEKSLPFFLIGHSAGGGFALRLAASPLGAAFNATVMLAPYLGYGAPTSRVSSGWDSADIPRVLALNLLNALGISCCNALPALAFAVPEHSTMKLTSVYSYRLMRNFAIDGDARVALTQSSIPIKIYVGENDEVMNAHSYSSFVSPFAPRVSVAVLPGLRHMTILQSKLVAEEVSQYIASIDGSVN